MAHPFRISYFVIEMLRAFLKSFSKLYIRLNFEINQFLANPFLPSKILQRFKSNVLKLMLMGLVRKNMH